MDNFKQASRLKIRFSTQRGLLTTEQLWDLPLSELDQLAVSLDEDYKNSKGKSFLEKRTTKDVSIKLQFDIVLDILQSKVEDRDAEATARESKEHNQKILALISEKKDESLKGKSIEELEKMLKL
jgi:hypothetical protein